MTERWGHSTLGECEDEGPLLAALVIAHLPDGRVRGDRGASCAACLAHAVLELTDGIESGKLTHFALVDVRACDPSTDDNFFTYETQREK